MSGRAFPTGRSGACSKRLLTLVIPGQKLRDIKLIWKSVWGVLCSLDPLASVEGYLGRANTFRDGSRLMLSPTS